MPSFDILVLPGDHIGPQVVGEAVNVLRAAEAHPAVCIDAHGIPLARMAAYLSCKHGSPENPSKITSIDKANVLAVWRLWRDAVTKVHDPEFPEIPLHHQLSDSLALIMVKNPRSLNGIVLCDNIFGDLFSDEAAAVSGPLASVHLPASPASPVRRRRLASVTWTSWPMPSMRLPAWPWATKRNAALRCALVDIGGTASTTEMGDAVVKALVQILDKQA
ncbi:uncharacterized protein TRUGW13939_00017 [Talaromyces rugulosus]|uniref:Isopropylmalate dehydrogenase-like domain-containing protein n=1 Tax=Talaromyces rugulosus TaxID=121627 RepID=A0A7H8QGB1_TALRU|nr:uncharacterized protein TRUGW13939_00017 [Talaromyces rugulosus]QKX52946.1 hypothetical protein TRUGW13939_00017 [Talaromyces rugulosus]